MKHLLATLPFYFMVLLTIHARGSTNSQTELTLMKITKTFIKANDGIVEYEFTLQSQIQIDGIHCIVLNIKKGSQETNYENCDISMIEPSENITIPYQVATDEFMGPVTLFMTVHNHTQHTLAYLVQQWLPQDIQPELLWVGKGETSNHKHSLSVKTSIDITIDDNPCNSDSSPCYFLHYPDENPLEICTMAKNTKELTDFYQCDKTLTPTDSGDISSVTDIILTEKQGGRSLGIYATYDSELKSMNILIYDESDSTSYIITDCNIEHNSKCVGSIKNELSDKPVYILLVALNNEGSVRESTEFEFVDYKTETQVLTKNIVEVRWNSANTLSYSITLKGESTEATTEVSQICGENDNAKCKAYFLNLDLTKKYIASVTYQTDVKFTVAAETNTWVGDIPHLVITKLTEPKTERIASESLQKIFVTLSSSQPITLSTLYMAIINSNDASKPIETIEFIEDGGEISETGRDFTFNIDKSLLTPKPNLTLVITAHKQDGKDVAVGVASVNTDFEEILPPTINEVGTNSSLWVRVWTDILDLTVNGNKCPPNKSTYFKKDDDFKAPLNLCRTAGINLGGEEMEQCKIDGTIIPLPGSISMKSIELIYPESGDPRLIFSGEFAQPENKLEAWYNSDPEIVVYSCVFNYQNTLGNCTIPSVTMTSEIDTILIVALHDNEVVESTAVEFEDYKTNTLGITEDIIQVSWKAKQKTRYDCYLDQDVPGSYNMLHVDCGAEDVNRCLAFFTDLTLGKPYTVRVNKQKNGELNIIGKKFKTSPDT